MASHTNGQYVRREGAKLITRNEVEGYCLIFNRGMKGVYQHCSEKQLHRYLREFDFRLATVLRLASKIPTVLASRRRQAVDVSTAS